MKIQKEARDHQLQKKSKISKGDKDGVLEERKMLAVQVGPDFSSKTVLLGFFQYKYVQQFKFIANPGA